VVSGPAGTFLLDTKRLSRPAVVVGDVLLSGRTQYEGAAFRAAAAELSEARRTNGYRTWVQPVVVIWGEFPQRLVEANGVVYLTAAALLPWLQSQRASARRAAAASLN
jgi:hypothetical protein